VCLIAALIPGSREQFFRAWLLAFYFVLGLSLGALVLVMLNYVVGGNWGFVLRRFHEASSRTLPLVALLFLPLLLGLFSEPYLYEWATPGIDDPKSEHYDKIIAKKARYLNAGFFVVRAVIYFAIWNTLAYVLSMLSKRQDLEKK